MLLVSSDLKRHHVRDLFRPPLRLMNSLPAASPVPSLSLETLEPRRLLSAALPVVELNVDMDDRRQTIDGFGSSMVDWITPPVYEEAHFYNDIANDLGATIVRLPIPQEFERYNDNNDPLSSNRNGFNTGALEASMAYAQQLELRQDQTVMGAVWSPPWWMKVNHDISGGGGSLKPEMRQEFAEYLAQYVILSKQEYGVDVDVISLQNEPLFVQSYPSTQYTPYQLAETFYVVQSHFEDLGLETKLMIADDLHFGDLRFLEWTDALVDAYARRGEALPETIWGTHYAPPNDADTWADVAEATGMPVWSTESGGKGTTSITGGMFYLEEALAYLNDGGLSAHVTWQSEGDGRSSWYYRTGEQDDDGRDITVKGGQYAGTKHLARWVRPGSVLIDSWTRNANSPNGGRLHAATFVDENAGSHTAVLVNMANDARQVEMRFDTPDDLLSAADVWKAHLTLEDENGNPDAWGRLASQGGTNEVPVTLSDDGLTVSFTVPARAMLTLTNVEGEPIEAVEAETGRVWANSGYPASLANLSYAHVFVQVGHPPGILNEGSDEDYLAIWDKSGRGLLHASASTMMGGIHQTLDVVLPIADRLDLDINLQDVDGMTPLMVAAAAHFAGIGYQDSSGRIDLVTAEDSSNRLDRFVDFGADVHVKDDLGRTALHWSAITSRATIVEAINLTNPHTQRMLELGADKNKVDRDGMTARDWAVVEGNYDAVAILDAWTSDSAAPELLAVETLQGGFARSVLTFDEAIATPTASDFVLVREDGLTADVNLLSVTSLTGGNTQVEVEAADGVLLPGGHWRLFPRSTVTDVAGNAFELPPETRGRYAFSSATFSHAPGDFDGDGAVGLADFTILRGAFNSPGFNGGDVNNDGWVNLFDFAILRNNFGVSIADGPTGDFGGRLIDTTGDGSQLILMSLPTGSPTSFSNTSLFATDERE